MHNRSILVDPGSRFRLHPFVQQFRELFTTPISTGRHWGVILFIASLYIFIPQMQPIDWQLNTENFWSAGLNAYSDPSKVYPPWGLILMVPYYLMQAEGARVLSVLVIGWLSYHRQWSLSKFLAIMLSPFFLVTMSKSNMDILVLVLPIVLWESALGSKWQTVGRGAALSILLLKPQGSMLIWLYLLWTSQDDWRNLVKPLMIVAVVVIPISLIGSPPLFMQWINNLVNTSPKNLSWWAINNISLTSFLSPLAAVAILIFSFSTLFSFMKWKRRRWSKHHTIASLLLVSMFLSPYTSQQSFSSSLAFVPSWASFFIQSAVLLVTFRFFDYWDLMPPLILLIGITSLYLFQPIERIKSGKNRAPVKVN